MATYVQRIEALTFEIPTKYSASETVSGDTVTYALLNDIAKEGISDIIDRCKGMLLTFFHYLAVNLAMILMIYQHDYGILQMLHMLP